MKITRRHLGKIIREAIGNPTTGPFEEDPVSDKNNDDLDSLDFKSAFRRARDQLGPGKTFSWKGKLYTTDYPERQPADTSPPPPPSLPDLPTREGPRIVDILAQLYREYDGLSARIIETLDDNILNTQIDTGESVVLTNRETGRSERVDHEPTVRQLIEREKPGGRVSKSLQALEKVQMGENLREAITRLSETAEKIHQREVEFESALKKDREALGDYLKDVYDKLVEICAADNGDGSCSSSIYFGAIQMGKACMEWFQIPAGHPRFDEIIKSSSERAIRVQYYMWFNGGFDPGSFETAGWLASLYSSDPDASKAVPSDDDDFESLTRRVSILGSRGGISTRMGMPSGNYETF